MLRRAVVSEQESCKKESTEKSTGEAGDRGCTAETGAGGIRPDGADPGKNSLKGFKLGT